jgi:peptidoglycan-associated lipoprotein
MKKRLFLAGVVITIVSICLSGLVGCSKKAAVKQSSEEPQVMTKQEAAPAPAMVATPEGEKTKPVPEPEAVPPPVESEQKVAPTQEAMQLEDIHFDFDKYDLLLGDRKILSNHTDWLLKNADSRVKIEGNCDERGTEEYNMALGQRRADEAKRYLVNMGVDKKRISTVSYGKDQPLDPGHNEEAWAKNRRDHFVLLKK